MSCILFISVVLYIYFFTYKLIFKGKLGNSKLMMGVMILNICFFYLVSCFSLGILMMEGYMVVFLMFGSMYKLDFNYFLFGYLLMTLSFFSISLIILKDLFFINIIFLMLIFKSFMVSVLILFSNKVEGWSVSILFYMLFSKGFVVFYGVLFKDSFFKENILSFSYGGLVFTTILVLWVFLILVSYFLLISKDFEGYFLSLLNLSHILVLLTNFFSFKMFLLAFFVDCLFFLTFLAIMVFKVNFVYNSDIGGGLGSMVLFIFSANSLGMPPLPSFFLELSFIYSNYYLINNPMKIVLILLMYLVTLFQFYILFLYMGSLSNKFKNMFNLSSEGFVILVIVLGISISVFFQFLFFYGL